MAELCQLGKETPYTVPDAAHRDAVRAQLLSSAERSLERARPPHQRTYLWTAAAACLLMFLLSSARVLWSRPDKPELGTNWRASVHPQGSASFIHERIAGDERVRLTDGILRIEVDPLRPGERFRVLAGDGEVEVRGTAFETLVIGNHLERVEVLHGRVEVRPHSGPAVVLGAGEHWQAKPQVEKTGSLTAEPRKDEELPPLSTPTPVVRPAPLPHHLLPRPSPPALSGPPTSPAEEAFLEGWTAMRESRYDDAAAAFTRANSKNAESPAGSEAIGEDASFWFAVALGRAGHSTEAMTAMDEFLRQHPTSPRRGEAVSILGWQLFKSGQLDAAERRFEEALHDPQSEIRSNARSGLSAIEAQRAKTTSKP